MERRNLDKHMTWFALTALVLTAAGCAVGPTGESQGRVDREVFELKAIAPARAAELLRELELGEVTVQPEGNAVAVAGSESVRKKAAVVLDLVDSPLPYTVTVLASVAQARRLPANEQFAAVLSTAAIGTFSDPPPQGRARRAIIDIHNDAVVAIAPVPLARDIVTLAQFGPAALLPTESERVPTVTISDAVATEEAVATEVQDEESEIALPPVAQKDTPEEIISATIVPEEEPELVAAEPEAESAVAVEEPLDVASETASALESLPMAAVL